mmetsp:Transcript_115692/g.327158  ORF Transcript_115692/g.327158 Transcript_115692/m.327158 type:complete len:345 (-) Transcript_115692:69-1103(-)
MKSIGGSYGNPAGLRHVVSGTPTMRRDHQEFVEEHNNALSCSLAASKALLQAATSANQSNKAPGRLALSHDTSPANARQGDASGTRQHRATQTARDLFAILNARQDGLATTTISASSADLGPRSDSSPRVISVRDFQRGKLLVAPVAPLPFPDQMTPGERKRAAAAANAIPLHASPRALGSQKGQKPVLANGKTSLLPGVRCDLGELATTPSAACSRFWSLLDKLVDAPEACLAEGPAPVALLSTPRRGGGAVTAPQQDSPVSWHCIAVEILDCVGAASQNDCVALSEIFAILDNARFAPFHEWLEAGQFAEFQGAADATVTLEVVESALGFFLEELNQGERSR